MKDVDKTYENVIGGGLKLKGKVISKSKGAKRGAKTSLKSQVSVDPGDEAHNKDYFTINLNKEYVKENADDSEELYDRNPNESKREILKRRIEKVKNDPTLTDSEKTFKIAQINRTYQRIEQSLKESHRQKIEKFNTKLSKLSEHFDIPKVGPG